MNNHRLYNKIVDNVEYKILEYYRDDKNDYKYVNKIINKYENLIIKIMNNGAYIPDEKTYHPYYNPGISLYKLTFYNQGKIIKEYYQTPEDYEKELLKNIRREKIIQINEQLSE